MRVDQSTYLRFDLSLNILGLRGDKAHRHKAFHNHIFGCAKMMMGNMMLFQIGKTI